MHGEIGNIERDAGLDRTLVSHRGVPYFSSTTVGHYPRLLYQGTRPSTGASGNCSSVPLTRSEPLPAGTSIRCLKNVWMSRSPGSARASDHEGEYHTPIELADWAHGSLLLELALTYRGSLVVQSCEAFGSRQDAEMWQGYAVKTLYNPNPR